MQSELSRGLIPGARCVCPRDMQAMSSAPGNLPVHQEAPPDGHSCCGIAKVPAAKVARHANEPGPRWYAGGAAAWCNFEKERASVRDGALCAHGVDARHIVIDTCMCRLLCEVSCSHPTAPWLPLLLALSSAMSTAPGAHFSPDTATETATPGSHRRLLRNMSNSIAKQSLLVAQSTKAAEQRKISTLVASFLPSGLLEQLSKAVDDQSVNPRVPMERPGVYLCISLSGLHQMLELPIEDYVFDKQLRQIFRRIAQSVHGAGGELIRMTGEHVLAVWSLPPPSEPFQNSAPPGSPGVQGSSFEERLLRAALNGATACALTVVDMLHDSLLWEEKNDSDQSQARTKQDPKPQQQQQQQQQQSSDGEF